MAADELTYQGQQVSTPPTHHVAERPWVAHAVAIAGLSSSGASAAHLAGASGSTVVSLAMAGSLATTARVISGPRRNHQRRRAAELSTVLWVEAKLLCDIKLHRWKGLIYPEPTRIVIRYPVKVQVDPLWTAAIVALCEQVLDMPLAVRRHQLRRRRLVLTRSTAPVVVDPTPAHPILERATALIQELFGVDAKIDPDWFDEARETLRAVAVKHRSTARVASAMYRAKVERILSTMLPGRWRCRWNVEEDSFVLEQRPVLKQNIPRPVVPITDENYWLIPIAQGEDGQTIQWDPINVSHLLVNGPTGAGKTVALLGVAIEACRRGWRLRLVDPKQVEFLGLREWPNVEVVATKLEHQCAVICSTWAEMEDRYSQITAGEASEEDFEPIVLMVDEFRDLFASATEWWSRNKPAGVTGKCPVFEKLFSIIRKGRTARIFLVLGTQRPDAEFLTGEARANFNCRLSLGRLDPAGAKMMWDSYHIGVTLPRKVKGRAIGVDEEEKYVESQVYWTPDPRKARKQDNAEDLALLEQLLPTHVTHERRGVLLDEDWLAKKDSKGRPNLWEAIAHARLVPLDELEEASDDGAEVIDVTAALAASAEVDDEYAGYEPPEDISAADLEVGDLIQHNDIWVVVERALSDGELLGIDWRDDDDNNGSITASPEEVIERRRPIDTPDDEDDEDSQADITGDDDGDRAEDEGERTR